MRKVTDKILNAFNAHKPAASGNTTTDGTVILLHGNRIAERRRDGSVWVTLAGWNTVTTRERLRALVSVTTVKGQPFIGGKPVKPDQWVKIG